MTEPSIEQGFENIELILEKMDSKEVSLEESFDLYKDAIEELKYCHSKIEQTEKAVMEISADGMFKIFEE